MVMSLLTRPKKSVATVVIATDGSGDFNCDGTADDIEINAALNSLPATGGCVYLKEGTYTITATITIPYSNIAVMGCGASTIITSGGAPLTLMIATNLTNLIFSDFYLYNNGGGGAVALWLNNCDTSFMNRIWITNCGVGMLIAGDDCIILNCVISDNSDGISGGTNAERWIITNNIIDSNINYGLNLANFYFNNILISNNHIHDNGNNWITGGMGISGNNYIISNNSIRENAGQGIALLGLPLATNNNNNIIGNVIDDNGNGIWLFRENYETLISDNQIINNTGYGIAGEDPFVPAPPFPIYRNQRNKATGNIFRNNTDGNIQDMYVFDEIFDNLEL